MACTAGKFQDAVGAMTCKECPSGHEQPNLGADTCDECQVISFLLTCFDHDPVIMTLSVIMHLSLIDRETQSHHNLNTDGKVHGY